LTGEKFEEGTVNERVEKFFKTVLPVDHDSVKIENTG